MHIAIPMRTRLAVGLGVLLLAALLLAACGGAATPAPTPVPPTATPVPPTQTPEPSPTLAPTETPEPEPTATEAPTAAAVSVDSTNCVTCHTSEETLQALAVEEAPAEALSEGEG